MSLLDIIKQHLFNRSAENSTVTPPSMAQKNSSTEEYCVVSNLQPSSASPEKTVQVESTLIDSSFNNTNTKQSAVQENTSPFSLQPHIADLETLLSDQPTWYEYIEQLMRQKQYHQLQNSAGDCFSLCEWLKTAHTELIDFSEYQDLIKEYQCFKQCAQCTLDAHQAGEFAEAIQLLRHDLLNHDKKVHTALHALLDKIRQEYAKICHLTQPTSD